MLSRIDRCWFVVKDVLFWSYGVLEEARNNGYCELLFPILQHSSTPIRFFRNFKQSRINE